ncbi:MAG: NADH-ubiquinone oxidoreductase-F iron-sulfur binding region domain-containing protein [Acidimicrobiia bacterium]
MDIRPLTAVATKPERSAVDGVLGSPTSGWDGGEFDEESGRVARGGRSARERRHLLLPALHALREAHGWISPGGLGYVCERLTIPPADAYGVASFYALLPTEPRPETVVHACDDIVCRTAGAEIAIAELEAAGTSVLRSPCLGRCETAPARMLDEVGSPFRSDLASDPPGLPQDPESLRLLHRVGTVDPESLEDYEAHGGLTALRRAAELGADGVLDELRRSNLRGRGGAAFPVAAKWSGTRGAPGETKHVIANGDESEPGTFKDRVLMEGDPFAVLEGLLIAAAVTGASHAWVYVRTEYPEAGERLRRAAEVLRAAGVAPDVSIEVRIGAGAYICGEETSLFASIEGYRGEPRQKPPFPTISGLFSQPTAINNVETLVAVLDIVNRGGDAFAAEGTAESTGPRLFSVSGAVGTPGVYEVPFGVLLGDLIDLAGGVEGELGAILLGGAAGSFVGPDALGMPLTLEDTSAAGATLGSGAVVVFDDATDFGDVVRRIAAFFRDESCGKCVPCRIGTVRQEEALIRLGSGSSGRVDDELRLLSDVDAVMTDASICGLGRTAASAVRSSLRLGLPGVVA